jgi:hypothetical protein
MHNLSTEDPEPSAPESRWCSEANDINPVSASVDAHEVSEIEAQSVPSGTSTQYGSGESVCKVKLQLFLIIIWGTR